MHCFADFLKKHRPQCFWQCLKNVLRVGMVELKGRPLSIPFLLRTSVKLTVKLARLTEGGNVGYTCTLVGVGEW